MLVLSRKLGEVIVIGSGEDAAIVILANVVSASKVRLGIEAPATVPVYRLEALPPDHPLYAKLQERFG